METSRNTFNVAKAVSWAFAGLCLFVLALGLVLTLSLRYESEVDQRGRFGRPMVGPATSDPAAVRSPSETEGQFTDGSPSSAGRQ